VSETGRVRTAIWAVAAVLAVAMGWRTANASFEDFGEQRLPFAGPQALWHREEEANRLLWVAGEREDLCGLGLIGYGPVWTGGFSYLHRDVPMLWATPAEALSSPGLGAIGASANYVLSRAEIPLPAEYTTVDSVDGAKLARRSGPCAPAPPSYSRLLPK
jgi:hypothetical protein